MINPDEKVLIDEYTDIAIAYGNTMTSVDFKKTNLYYDHLQKIFKKLVKQGCDYKLLDLRNNPNVWVQLWSATQTLEIDETNSLNILNNLQQGGGITAYVAKNTIQEWKSGNLKFR